MTKRGRPRKYQTIIKFQNVVLTGEKNFEKTQENKVTNAANVKDYFDASSEIKIPLKNTNNRI